jgi:hypothetical protein
MTYEASLPLEEPGAAADWATEARSWPASPDRSMQFANFAHDASDSQKPACLQAVSTGPELAQGCLKVVASPVRVRVSPSSNPLLARGFVCRRTESRGIDRRKTGRQCLMSA